jgi:hypothetical protein
MAQGGPATGGNPPVAGSTAGKPAAAATSSHPATKHHEKLYMSNRTHKGSKMTPATNAKPQMKQQ